MLGEDGVVYGPVTRGELDQWFREGRISARCQLAVSPSGPWMPAAQVYPQLAGGTAPTTPSPWPPSPPEFQREWWVALLLATLPPLTGLCGLHRFYTGHIAIGIIQLLTFGGCGIWQLIDIILLVSGGIRDVDGNPLV